MNKSQVAASSVIVAQNVKSANDWWNSQSPDARNSMIGAGIGSLGGLLFGGEHRLRNMLLGALGGAGLGYATRYLGPRPNAVPTAPAGTPSNPKPTSDFIGKLWHGK